MKYIKNFWNAYLARRARPREYVKFLENDPYGYQLRQIDSNLIPIYVITIVILIVLVIGWNNTVPVRVTVTNPVYPYSAPYPAPGAK